MSRRLRGLLILSLIANVAFAALVSAFVWRKGGLPYVLTKLGLQESQAPIDEGNWHNLSSTFAVLPRRPGSIVFLGDSLTRGVEWAELLDEPLARNRGISGDRADWLLRRIEEAVGDRPAMLFLMIGVNDLLTGREVSEILNDYEAILIEVRRSSPETRVFAQSVLPVNNPLLYRNFTHTVDSAEVRALNQGIRALAEARGVTYIDLYPIFSRDDELPLEYTHDGIHLNGAAYMAWKAALAPYLRR